MSGQDERPVRALMGWCSTGHHKNCRQAYWTTAGVRRECSCSCHETT